MEYSDYLKTVLSEDEIAKLEEAYNKEGLNGLRVNLLKSNKETIGSFFSFTKDHPFVKEAFIYDNSIRPGKDPLFNAGAYYIQEPSAMMPAYFLDIQKGDKVLDLCAAPGGKSSQILSKLANTGILVSNDISNKRAYVLSENIERMGASNAYVLNEEIDSIENIFYGFFDKVVLDAPCSGMGMFRKNKEVKDDWTYNKALSLSEINKKLIMQAYNCLKENGIMVYSTCTFTKEEDEDVINYLLDNTNASVVKIEKHDSFYESSVDGAIRLYPFKFEGEGHFVCLIKCNDNHESNIRKGNKYASRKDMELYRDFEKNNLNITLDGHFIKMGDELHYLKEDHFSLDRLKVLRNGLHLGTIKKDRFEPNHAFAMYLDKDSVKKHVSYDHLSNSASDYLKGMTLETSNNKGYVLVCINDISVGWGKDDTRIIKNLYPKGLRVN